MSLLLIDNQDSFTYNLVQMIESAGVTELIVRQGNELSMDLICELRPEKILISPGPGHPADYPIIENIVQWLGRGDACITPTGITPTISVLGVCLGHQAIAHAFGARIIPSKRPVHGKTSPVQHDNQSIFRGIPANFPAMRYHSLEIDPDSLPDCFTISACAAGKLIMGIRHKSLPMEGVQFHPESILTQHGQQLIKNWLSA